jgi:hypothetical protein
MAVTHPESQPKSYSKPTLTIYGNIHDLTQSVGGTGASDGGPSPTSKTTIGGAAPPRRRA